MFKSEGLLQAKALYPSKPAVEGYYTTIISWVTKRERHTEIWQLDAQNHRYCKWAGLFLLLGSLFNQPSHRSVSQTMRKAFGLLRRPPSPWVSIFFLHCMYVGLSHFEVGYFLWIWLLDYFLTNFRTSLKDCSYLYLSIDWWMKMVVSNPKKKKRKGTNRNGKKKAFKTKTGT